MPNQWTLLRIPGDATALELLGQTVSESGAEGIVAGEDELQAFYRTPVIARQALARLNESLKAFQAAGILPEMTITVEEVEEIDWVGRWRRSLGPIPAGTRFLIVPPGVDTPPDTSRFLLRLEPRMAFGTGEHATTRMAISLLESTLRPGDTLLDLGCGNGVLAIAALLLGGARAYAIDNEEEAVAETAENAALHGVADKLTVTLGDVLRDPLPARYNLLLANIFVRPILQGLPDWLTFAEPNARFIFTGVQEGEEEKMLIEGVRRLGLEIVDSIHEDRWFAARCERSSA